MVRFSDMLGGNTDPEEPRATTIPASAPIPPFEADDDPDPAAEIEAEVDTDAEEPLGNGEESPEAVLDRLTQYATSNRSADQAPVPGDDAPAPEPPAAPPDPLTNLSDDLLPQGKSATRRSSRRSKRRP